MKAANLLDGLPSSRRDAEVFDSLLLGKNVQIERIVSQGQVSPETGWYDQDHDEWVLVFSGAGQIEFEDGESLRLEAGDYVNIAAHRRHKVSWTDPDVDTVWVAVRY